MTNKASKRLGWLNGEWGDVETLSIPINDRAITIGDGIFETILILNGKIQLLSNHIKRWQRSAYMLGMEIPPSDDWVLSLINEGIDRASLQNKHGVVRLNWSRGSALTRGVSIEKDGGGCNKHRFWMEINSYQPSFNPITTKISQYEQRSSKSRLNQCKTFGYGQSIQAQREAEINGYDKGLLLSTSGEICCGTTGNLLINRENQWLTPPLTSGCLPGIMRSQGLKKRVIKIAHIHPIPEKDDKWLLINSLSCHPIYEVDSHKLKTYQNPETLWNFLLDEY